MGKMDEMAMTIEELHSAAAAITEAANWLAQQFSGESADKQPKENIAAKVESKPAIIL